MGLPAGTAEGMELCTTESEAALDGEACAGEDVLLLLTPFDNAVVVGGLGLNGPWTEARKGPELTLVGLLDLDGSPLSFARNLAIAGPSSMVAFGARACTHHSSLRYSAVKLRRPIKKLEPNNEIDG